MKLKIKATLRVPKRYSKDGFITPIEKGTIVEFDPTTRKVKHPSRAYSLIIDEGKVEKYFNIKSACIHADAYISSLHKTKKYCPDCKEYI